MAVQSYKEYDLSQRIINGEENYFAINSKDIKGITIGGIDGNLRLVSYPVVDHESEVIVLEVMNDGDRYFFKPIFSDDYLLILDEDYYYGTSPELFLGEIRLSTTRTRKMIEGNLGILNNNDYSSVESNRDLIMCNPIGIYLSSIEPLSALPNNGSRMVHYNVTYANDLKHKIGRMKFDAQTVISEAYEREDKYRRHVR